MSLDKSLTGLYQEIIDGDVSYSGFREQSWKNFIDLGLPPKRSEEWKYTDISKIYHTEIKSESREVTFSQIEEYVAAENYLVFVDGIFQENLSSYSKPTGLEIKIIQSKDKELSENTNSIGSVLPSDACNFVALNSALFNDFVIFEVEDNKIIKDTFQVISYTTSGFSASRVFVKLGASSSFSLIETHVSKSENTILTCPVSEYKLEENSELRIYKTVSEGLNTYHVGNQQAASEKSARFYNSVFNLSSGVTRNNVNGMLQGEQSYISLLGLSVLDQNEHVDNCTLLDHKVPHCDSYEVYKGIYAGQAKGIFNGTIIVQPDAQKTNAIQSNQALLLSDTAESYSQPQLKIWADDVKCTHGATCGDLDQDALFYLLSRGIPKTTAKAMLIKAFAGEVLTEVKDPVFSKWIEEKVTAKLNSIFSAE